MRNAALLAALFLGALLGARLNVRVEPPPPVQASAAPAARLDFVDIARGVQPAVVSIDAVRGAEGRHSQVGDPFFPPPDELFVAPDRRVPAVGSGLVVTEDGYILTNHHVVDGVTEIEVTFSDDSVAAARLMGSDPCSDLALLKVNRKGLATVPWGKSSELETGQWVLAFGSPYRMRGSLSHGIVSGMGRKELGIADFEDFIQTDAAINPGNSGGPLVNLEGQVVGINTAILSRTGGSHGISLAIPSEVAQPVLAELLSHGRVARSWLGLFLEPLDSSTATRLRLQDTHGALVTSGYTDGPAGRAGFRVDDVILELDGGAVKSDRHFRSLLARTPVGTRLRCLVWRSGRPVHLEVTTKLRGTTSHGQPVRGI